MKIAHLADLHIGKKLEEMDRNPEIREALKETAQIIEQENIKAVIIAGDIFDHARPSVESMSIFYSFLKELKEKKVEKIFIIAGNHDDESLLEVARDFLEFSGIHIWGKITSDLESYFLNTEIEGEPLFITALPYLNDIKILSEIDKTRIEVKSPAQRYIETYQVLLDYFKTEAAKASPGAFKIFIGHMFVEGSELSQTERESSLEYYLCVPKSAIESGCPFDYSALGHIHKYQESLSKLYPIYYSGSLIRLNFSERGERKGFRVIDTQSRKVNFIELKTPKILEELKIEIKKLDDLDALSEKKDPHKLFKIRVSYPSSLLALEIREKIREILGPNVKTEFLIQDENNQKLGAIKAIQTASDLMEYYFSYKSQGVKPEVMEKLKEITEEVFNKN